MSAHIAENPIYKNHPPIPVIGFARTPQGPAFIRPDGAPPLTVREMGSYKRIVAISLGGNGKDRNAIQDDTFAQILTGITNPETDMIMIIYRDKENSLSDQFFRLEQKEPTPLVKEMAGGFSMVLKTYPETEFVLSGHSTGAQLADDLRQEMNFSYPEMKINFDVPLLLLAPAIFFWMNEATRKKYLVSNGKKGIYSAHYEDDITQKGDATAILQMMFHFARHRGNMDLKNHVKGLGTFIPAINEFLDRFFIQREVRRKY